MFDAVPLNQPLDIKFIVTTKSGTRVKKPGQIQVTTANIEFLKSPFELKDELKSMKGARWHGFDDPPRKIWTASNCFRNWFQLRLLLGEDVFAWFDRPLQHFEYDRPLMSHQKDMTDLGLTYHYQIWGAEMGCIDGDAIVNCNRARRGFKITLAKLFEKWSSKVNYSGKRGQKKWDSSITTYIRSLCDGTFRLNKLVNVLDKGIKPVVRVTLASGKTLRCTPDHEIYTSNTQYVSAEKLQVGDTVLTNGTWVDKDGYVRVGGLTNKHPRCTTGGVYEHILVMESELGRSITEDEIVHHKNAIKHDNRIKNLELHTKSTHAMLHGQQGGFERMDGGRDRVFFVPKLDTVVSVVSDGETHVYDLVMADPHRNFVADGFVVANCGKTLSAIELMEKSGKNDFWWIGPKSGLYAVEREFKKWGISDDINLEIMTYEGLVKRMSNWPPGQLAPQGVIFDESSRAKNPTAKRTMAAQALADGVRKDWGHEGYVILMSGTPSPKSPLDWWSQSEIAWPGYLKEGSQGTFGYRLGIYHKEEGIGGTPFHKLVTWRDNELKCCVCGELAEDGKHNHLLDATTQYLKADKDYHDFQSSTNEIAYLYERLKGLVVIKHKKDCLDLPDKRYRIINCEPKPSTLRVAQALLQAAPNTITGLTWLRELSDGFQYRNKIIGKETCPVCDGTGITSYWVDPADSDKAFTMTDMLDPEYVQTLEKQDFSCASCGGTGEVDKMERTVKEVPCPKEDALINLLDENEETGRLVVFAGFTGSIDKITALCLKQSWDVIRVDGRGWQVRTKDGILDEAPLDYWADLANHQRVCFVAHPKSGGMGLTLTESRMAVYYSNSYESESRSQSEDRIHRISMDTNKGATIVDLIHLPTDLKVLELLKDNRRLELMSMGDIQACFEGVEDNEEGQQQS